MPRRDNFDDDRFCPECGSRYPRQVPDALAFLGVLLAFAALAVVGAVVAGGGIGAIGGFLVSFLGGG